MNEKLSQKVAIRSATKDDAVDVAHIYVKSWNVGFGGMAYRSVTAELIERWRLDLVKPVPQRWWVAELKGSLVGFAGIGPSRDPIDSELGELDTIAIAPSYWRAGIGRALMSTALRYLIADGYREAVLWTFAEYERGQRFYEAMGWKLAGNIRAEGRQVQYRYRLSHN